MLVNRLSSLETVFDPRIAPICLDFRPILCYYLIHIKFTEKEITVPYRPKIVEELRKVSKRCFICRLPFADNEFSATHSGTGYHLELEESDVPGEKYRYRVTDPPDGHPEMMGRTFGIGEFKQFGFRYFADAVRVHHHCHKKVHALALRLCREKIPGFKGTAVTANLLAEATFNYWRYVGQD